MTQSRMGTGQANPIARTNEALLVVLTEAHEKMARGENDANLVDLVRRAQQLHVALIEALLAGEPDVDPRLRVLAATMSERVALLADAIEGIDGKL